MPTAHKRLQKRQTKRQQRRAIKLHSTLSVGHRLPVPTPPDFGPPKFTEADQAAHPDEPMTRVIKDVIRVGEWKEGFDEHGEPILGQYTPEEIAILFSNAIALMANGDPINFGKSHGDEQLIIPTDELISPIDDVRLDNGIIWASSYVTPEQKKYLTNPAMKVSAGMVRDYTAGNGKKFKGRTMLHVAVTDRPVVGGQGPFIALSNYVALGTWDEAQAKKEAAPIPTPAATPVVKKNASAAVRPTRPKFVKRTLKARKFTKIPLRKAGIRFNNTLMQSAIALANSLQGGGSMDLVTALNLLFAKFGLDPIPEGVTPEQLPTLIAGIAMAIPSDEVDEPDAATDAADANNVIDDAAAGGGGGTGGAPAPAMAMANLLKQVDAKIAAGNKPVLDALAGVTTMLKSKADAEVVDKKANYMKFRNALGKGDANGLAVPEAMLAEKDKLAEKLDWDTGILEGLHPTIKLSNLVSSAGASAQPNDRPTNGLLTDEEVAARIKAKGGKVENMPKSGAV